MNLKDFTLKLAYTVDGKPCEKSIESNCLSAGYADDDICVKEDGAGNRVKITLTTAKNIELVSANVLYDRYFETNELFFANGFQSWTTSREYKRGDVQNGLNPISKIPFIKKYAGATGDYHFTKYGKNLYHSFTYSYLRYGEKVYLIGSLNERTGYTIIYADMEENVLEICKDVEGVLVSANGEYELFNYIHTHGTYDEVFDTYFNAYPLKHTGRVDHFAGYTSWYNYYQNINESIILRDLEGLKRAGDAANLFQIDDGYETKVGDWTIDEKKFPRGLAPVVDAIHSQGLRAGLWCAPFSAQYKANIVKNHPDWLIKDKKGKPVVGGIAWGGFYALDLEKEEVRTYIRQLFSKIFDEWGFDMVKLDFLYSAAIYPRNGKSRGTLMCEAMDFLRECCGDKILLGCGVPLGPSFGVVDACRIGCDAETSFKDKFYVGLTNQEVISTRNAMNNAIFRRHLNGRIMANDPDVFFLRKGGVKTAKYNDTQKKLLARINHMFGSVLFVSDNVGEFDENQMSILLDSYKPFGGKVTMAEYVAADKIKITYTVDGACRKLIFNTISGEYTDIV